jgi:hypothetical protein
MNSKNFIQTLRKIIREEVQSAVRTEINSILNESSKPADVRKPAPKQAAPVNVAKKQYVKNSWLNEILNETSAHTGTGNSLSMLEEEINYNDYSEWPTMNMNSAPSMRTQKSVVPSTDVNGNPVNVNALPDDVVNALTKDYSALMKAIDKKKGK